VALACCSAFAAPVDKKVSQHSAVSTWQCPLTNCALKSPLASAGPAFPDGVRFFAVGRDGKDSRAACPFGDDDEPEPTTKEYNKYMKAMDHIGDMNSEERRAWALAHQNDYLNDPVVEPKVKDPSVHVTKRGVEAVNSTTWSELRAANKHDFIIAFYAPWCPHCKAFVTAENAPLKALSESLEKVKGPYVVSFDIIKDKDPPLVIDAVPTLYLFKTNGQAIEFKGDGHDMEALMAFALDKPAPALLTKKVVQHLRQPSM
jgi:thiol-disulfide isomerase/thioredoxin